jgi:hypothetical protein
VVISKRQTVWVGIELTLAVLFLGGFGLGLWGLRVSRAAFHADAPSATELQVTVFAIVATPASKAVDSNLAGIKPQLEKLLPRNGFKLLDVQSKRIGVGESVACELTDGYRAQTFLVRSADEDAKIELRCELRQANAREFSTLVRAPLNQLFFYERTLPNKSQLLIGVGARY